MKKNLKRFIATLLILVCCSALVQAQESKRDFEKRSASIQAEEVKIETFIAKQMMSQFPKEELKNYLESFETHLNDHKHEKPTQKEMDHLIDGFKRNFFRKKYFKEFPKSQTIYRPNIDASNNPTVKSSNQVCDNGDFEDGDFTNYSGFTSDWQGARTSCNTIPQTNVNYTVDAMQNTDHFEITTNLADPLIPALNQTNNNSNFAAKINAATPCFTGAGINMLSRTFVANQSGLQNVCFSYALVMESHNNSNPNAPFFVARILDASNVELDRICVVSDLTNPIFNIVAPSGQCHPRTGAPLPFVWLDWTCDGLDFNGVQGQTYTIEFFMADCSASGHFGYAYIDDICTDCTASCDCGEWLTKSYAQLPFPTPTSQIHNFNCGESIANPFEAHEDYRFIMQYNCLSDDCLPTYTVIENLDGTVTTTVDPNGFLFIDIRPNEDDCGVNSITVIPNCDGVECDTCTFEFIVNKCYECVAPINEEIECDDITNNPILTFCLENIGTQAVSYFGFKMPPGINVNNLTPQSTANIYFNIVLNEWIIELPTPLAPNATSCTYSLELTGGYAANQNLCIETKSFGYVDMLGNVLDCCINPEEMCVVIPECSHWCADILNAKIECDDQGQRILSYNIRNNYFPQIDGFISSTTGTTPTDGFNYIFQPNPLSPQGQISPTITHVLPASMPSGIQYCFQNKVSYHDEDNECHTCYSETVCVTIPICEVEPSWEPTDENPVVIGVGEGRPGKGNEPGADKMERLNSGFLLAPNPAKTMVTISSPNKTSIHSVKVIDLSGRILINRRENDLSSVQVPLHEIPSGIYFINVNDQHTYKLIKQ